MILSLFPGSSRDEVVLRRVRARGSQREPLRLRQRFESAVARIEWMPPGLPPGAILLVRRLSPARREGAAVRSSFGELVAIALREQASRARRPWLHADAIDAGAVLFADEAELIACLARDWLLGVIAHRWWWPGVLLDSSPHAWLRREVVPRADRLVPAIALLASDGKAAAVIALLEPVDCEQAIAAVARSFAVPLVPAYEQVTVASSRKSETGTSAAPIDVAVRAIQREALRRLLHEVPELRQASLGVAQQRLLALALALVRAPTWARTQSMASALESLNDRGMIERADWPTLFEPYTEISSVTAASAPAAMELSQLECDEGNPRRGSMPENSASPIIATHRSPVAATESSYSIREEIGARGPVELPRHPPEHDPSNVSERIVQAATAVSKPPWIEGIPGAVDAVVEPVLARDRESTPYPVGAAPRVATQFGGLFYLLNAALALELYGDFTLPRTQGLALSPWDWLAMVGRAWFGDEIVTDPVWTALADLAGRTSDEEPGRDFQPPSDDWFHGVLAMLEARIALAVDHAEGDDLPALVCRHKGDIEMTAGMVHVHFRLSGLPLSIRIAGLDRDPGWIPAAGRDVRFHFT